MLQLELPVPFCRGTLFSAFQPACEITKVVIIQNGQMLILHSLSISTPETIDSLGLHHRPHVSHPQPGLEPRLPSPAHHLQPRRLHQVLEHGGSPRAHPHHQGPRPTTLESQELCMQLADGYNVWCVFGGCVPSRLEHGAISWHKVYLKAFVISIPGLML